VTFAPDLFALSHAEKDALILALFERLAAAETRTAALEARIAELTCPPNAGQLFQAAVRARSRTRQQRQSRRRARAGPAPAARCIRTPIG